MSGLARIAPAVFVLLWSTGWISAKYAAPHADPLWFLTIRFACAFAAIAAFAVAVRAPWPEDARGWGHAIVSGILLHGLYLGGVWWAVKHGLSAGISGLLAALQPLLTALLAPYLLGERVTLRQWLGVALGLAGVLLVLSPKLGLAAGDTAWTALMVNVAAMLAVTAGSFYQKRFVPVADLRTVPTGTVSSILARSSSSLPSPCSRNRCTSTAARRSCSRSPGRCWCFLSSGSP